MNKTRSINEQVATFQKTHSPDSRIKDLLPRSLKEILLGRRSSRVQKTSQFFRKYTDQVYRAPGEELWEDLLRTRRYLELHLLLYAKHDDKSDDGPLVFYHAELPEIMLEMIQQSFHSEFFIGSAKMCCVPSLALSVLTTFFYAYSDTFLLVPEKLFRDSTRTAELVTLGVLRDRLKWFDKLSLVQMYGAASYSRGCILFLQQHLDLVCQLCTMVYRGMEIVLEKLQNREINWQNESLSIFLTTFREDEDLETTARLFGIHTINQSVMFYKNIMDSTQLDFALFQDVGKVVMRSKVLQHFSFLVRYIMIWYEPGLYLNTLLSAVSQTLKMNKAVNELLGDNLADALEHKAPVGMETFKFWNHDSKYPNTVAWFLLHAFCQNKRFGSDWCVYILCYVLDTAEQEVVDMIVENFGPELMDLAHMSEISAPKKTMVQAVILEALLRHGRVQHKEFLHSNIYEGETELKADKMKEFVLEAALFCKKAQCEAQMSVEKKQKLALEADVVKDEGNALFRANRYPEAILKYSEAIALCPLSARKKQAIYYSNRAECHLRAKDPKPAIHDCNRSLCLDNSAKVKVQWRRSRAYQKLDLDYPAWLDMKCLEKDWNLTSEQSGLDFSQLLISLGLQVGVVQRKSVPAFGRRTWNLFLYNP